MFKEIHKWEFRPYNQGYASKPKPLEDLNYNGYKLEDRYVVIEFNADCAAPHFLFHFIEKRYREIQRKDSTWEIIQYEKSILNVVFYPKIYSKHYLNLHALHQEEIRGSVAKSAIISAFHDFFKNYEDEKKMVSGVWEGKGNPLSVMFPEYWEWLLKITQNLSHKDSGCED